MAIPVSKETLFTPQEVHQWAEEYTKQGGDFLRVVWIAFHHLVTDRQTGESHNRAEEMVTMARWELYEEIAQIISSPTQLGSIYRDRLAKALSNVSAIEAYDHREWAAEQALFTEQRV